MSDCAECNKKARKIYCDLNREEVNRKAKLQRSSEDKKHKAREYRLKKKFNITIEEYDKMLSTQEYRCAICKAHQDNYKKRFAVDHSHVTNKIRGLLCLVCNRMICGVIDKRAKAKNVQLSEMEYVERLHQYYKKSS